MLAVEHSARLLALAGQGRHDVPDSSAEVPASVATVLVLDVNGRSDGATFSRFPGRLPMMYAVERLVCHWRYPNTRKYM